MQAFFISRTFVQRVFLLTDGASVSEFARLVFTPSRYTIVSETVAFVNDLHSCPLLRMKGLKSRPGS